MRRSGSGSTLLLSGLTCFFGLVDSLFPRNRLLLEGLDPLVEHPFVLVVWQCALHRNGFLRRRRPPTARRCRSRFDIDNERSFCRHCPWEIAFGTASRWAPRHNDGVRFRVFSRRFGKAVDNVVNRKGHRYEAGDVYRHRPALLKLHNVDVEQRSGKSQIPECRDCRFLLTLVLDKPEADDRAYRNDGHHQRKHSPHVLHETTPIFPVSAPSSVSLVQDPLARHEQSFGT